MFKCIIFMSKMSLYSTVTDDFFIFVPIVISFFTTSFPMVWCILTITTMMLVINSTSVAAMTRIMWLVTTLVTCNNIFFGIATSLVGQDWRFFIKRSLFFSATIQEDIKLVLNTVVLSCSHARYCCCSSIFEAWEVVNVFSCLY